MSELVPLAFTFAPFRARGRPTDSHPVVGEKSAFYSLTGLPGSEMSMSEMA
jgi:hypothetical protein